MLMMTNILKNFNACSVVISRDIFFQVRWQRSSLLCTCVYIFSVNKFLFFRKMSSNTKVTHRPNL